MKLKQMISIWLFFIIPVFIFGYEIINKNELERFQLIELQAIEFMSIIIFSFLIYFFEIYEQIKNHHLQFLICFVMFLLLTTVKWAFDSNLWLLVHILCYLYLLIVLSMVSIRLKNNE